MKTGCSLCAAAITIALVSFTVGCGQKPPVDPPPSDDNAEVTPTGDPVAILTDMVQAYRAAEAYSDQATAKIEYRLRGEIKEHSQPLSVAFVRPNKLLLKANDVNAASNGKQMQVRISGATASELDGQFVNKPAPERFIFPDMALDQLTHELLEQGLARHPPQLELLLANEPLQEVFADDMPKTLLEAHEINGRLCHRVHAKLPDRNEAFIFWIDQKSHILRRLEFPPSWAPQVSGLQGVADVTLAADFTNAAFLEPLDQSYQISQPENAKVVDTFVLRPPDLATRRIGKPPEPFEFARLNSGSVSLDDIKGKVTALIWFNNIPAGELAMKRLNSVAAKLNDDSKFAFYGVCVESIDTSNADIAKLTKRWEVDVTVVRDLKAYGRDSFDIPAWPTLVVLNKDSQIQIFEPGNFEKMEDQLPDLMKRIAAGEDLAAIQREVVAEKKAAYAAHLNGVDIESSGGNEVVLKIPTIEVPAASAPDRFKLRELWSATKFKAPGKFVVAPTKESYHVFALDGFRTIVELNDAGEEVSRQELPLPEGVAVSELRTVTTATDKQRFAAFEILGKQLFVFDESWKLLFAYPDIKQDHQGIRDALLADLDAEGDAEAYVGFWFPVGIHQVDMKGNLRAADKQLTSVLSLSQTPPNSLDWRKLIAAGAEGFVLRFNQFLKSDPKIRIPDTPLHSVTVSPTATDGMEEYLGLSFVTETMLRVIAFDQKLKEHWSFETALLPRPPIAHSLQVTNNGETIPYWLVALADGSISLVRLDGASSDFFRLGAEILHAEIVQHEGKNILITTTPKRIFAQELVAP